VKALIYDTSGQEIFNSISKNYMRQGDGVFIVYDITDTKSYDSVEYWVAQIKELRVDNPFMCIVGNKADLEDQRAINLEVGKKFAESIGAFFMETSCKNILSIEQAFSIAIKQAYTLKIEKETEINLT
jgi:small GTP-binding protein